MIETGNFFISPKSCGAMLMELWNGFKNIDMTVIFLINGCSEVAVIASNVEYKALGAERVIHA